MLSRINSLELQIDMEKKIWSRKGGFTLAELLIVVAVIGILASFAYPSYQNSVRKARRTDAQAVMMELAQWMERFYTENHGYDKTKGDENVSPPANLLRSPANGDIFYAISLINLAPNTYTIQAAPKSGQKKDKCYMLTLQNTGVKGIKDAQAGVEVGDCW